MSYKVETIEQFKILDFLKANFNIGFIDIETIDRKTMKITDVNNDTMIFKYENNQVIYE